MSAMLELEDLWRYDARGRRSRIIPTSSGSSRDEKIDIESLLICGICSSPLPPSAKRDPIDYKNFNSIDPVGHRTRGLPDYESSSERGCETCAQIVSKVLQISSGTDGTAGLELCENLRVFIGIGRPFIIHLFVAEPGEWAGKSLWQQFNQNLENGTEEVGKGEASRYLNYYLKHNALTLPDDSYTGSDEIATRINAWLTGCQTNHQSCQPSQNGSLPRRILEIDAQNDLFRLIEDCAQSYSYACLSHRWSESTKEVSLMQANMQRRKSWTPIDSLPRLFRDTMLVIKNAGLRHLWIDCLCIIQDSDGSRDWHREAAMMANIYENASFTIVATWCAGSEQSLFSTVDEAYQPVSIDNGSRRGGILRLWPEHPDLWADKEEQQWLNFPLLGRGWVLQEVVLSKRLLLFGKNEVYWICREASWCLCGLSNLVAAQAGVIRPVEDLMDLPWTKIITRFTSMDLTFQTDRLPALGGIASRYGTQHKLTYAAGLWKENLMEELLWMSDGGFEGRLRPYPLVAPTWSWASTDGKIEFESSQGKIDGQQLSDGIEISIQTVIPFGSSIYGQLRSARLSLRILTVRGQIFYGQDAFKACYQCVEKEDEENEVDAVKSKERSEVKYDAEKSKFGKDLKIFQSDEVFEQSQYKFVVVIVEGEFALVFTDYALSIEGPGHIESGSEVTVASWMVGPDSTGSIEVLNGLVLRRVGQDSESGICCYERIGIVYQDEPDSWSLDGSTEKFWVNLLCRSELENLILV